MQNSNNGQDATQMAEQEFPPDVLRPEATKPDELLQLLAIAINESGNMQINYRRIDPLGAMAALAEALWVVYRDTFERGTIYLPNGNHTQVCTHLDDKGLNVTFSTHNPKSKAHPKADVVIAKAVLLAAFFGLCEKSPVSAFNPVQAVFDALPSAARESRTSRRAGEWKKRNK